MKVRSDYVSNSSSSSFMLVGHAFDNDEDLKRGWLHLHPGDESKLDEGSESYDEDLCCDIAYPLAGELGLEVEHGIYDYYGQVVIGLPFDSMEDDETKKQFIERISNAFKRAFPEGIAVEPIKDGGYEG